MYRVHIAQGLAHVGLALREPEEFALRWRRGEAKYGWPVWAALVLTALPEVRPTA